MRRKMKLIAVIGLAFMLAFTLAGGAVAAQPPEMVKVLISFDRQPGPAEEGIVRGAGGTIKYTYHLVPAIAASIPGAAIQGLLRNPNVTRVEPDIEVQAIDQVLPWGVDRIDAEVVHAAGNKGTGVTVAILDTGIDLDHPDLNVVGGVNFTKGKGYDDKNGHGTHVAGIAAALDNTIGVIGVAPGVSLYAVKVLGNGGTGSYSDVIAGLQWAVDNGMQVTNNSYGSSGDPGQTVKNAFDAAYAKGVLSVAAAGNESGGNVIYPAKYDSVIAVSATKSDDSLAGFSSVGPEVELAAPGDRIYSTYKDGGYREWGGTSMASPHVAGTAALVIWAGVTDADGEYGIANEVRTRLQATAEDLGDTGKDNLYGYGLVDAENAALGTTSGNNLPGATPPTTGAIAGTVTNASDGTAIGGATVTVDTGQSATTAVDGTYTITDVPTGDRSVTASADGFESQTKTATVYENQTTTVDFALSETTTKTILADSTEFRAEAKGKSGKVKLLLDVHVVEGDVGGPPVAGATVSVEITAPDGTLYTGSGDTDSNGDIAFEVPGNAQSGTWTAEVTNIEEPGYQFDPTKGDTTAEITL